MQIACDHCNTIIRFDDSAPKFCSECGGSLKPSASSVLNDVTITRSLSAADREQGRKSLPKKLESVGPYRLVRKLGQGGMGTVYEAVHSQNQRRVALKLLSSEVRGTEEMVHRFRRESQIAASINHPRSTFVYEAGQHEDQLYITMELMGGGTLKDVVADEGPMTVGRGVDCVLDMIDGLQVAHNAGIVHRDLKPSNSFVDTDGRIKVGDFGLAKSFLGDSQLTQTGTFMGTPQFAAPEQIRNDDVDERTDIYALGGTLFYLLTGRAPFVGNPAQVISSIATDVPPRVSEFARNIPKPLVRLIAQTLEKDPNRRPFNLNMLRDGLRPFSTRGAMAADPGRRMAAFFLDSFLFGVAAGLLTAILSPLFMFGLSAFNIDVNPQLLGFVIVFPATVLSFAICEACWGRTAGKWIFGMRVVNTQAQSPAFFTALVRACLIPGIMLAISHFAALILLDFQANMDMRQVMELTFKSQAFGMLGWIPNLLMIATARPDNGYQCIHDRLTGTRVVRLAAALELSLLDQFAVTVPTRIEGQRQIGNYQVVGLFRDNADGQSVFLGRDSELDRPIWLFAGFTNQALSDERKNLTRPSRLRVIRQSEPQDGQSWYSTESAPGLPLHDVLKDPRGTWQSYCPLIRDIAHEFGRSKENGLIPEPLGCDQLWLDHTGRVRVLDHALVSTVAIPSAVPTPPAARPEHRQQLAAVDTIQTTLARFMANHDHPVSVMDINNELQERREQDDVFDWVVNQLNESIERPSTWNWVDRIGLLAISTGLEFSLLSTFLFLSILVVMQFGQDAVWSAVISCTLGLILAGAFGFFFRGGPAMHLAGISLRCNRDKTVASRPRAMVRSLIAWTPWVFLISILIFVMFHQLNKDPAVVQITPQNSDIAVPALLVSLITAMLIGLGMLVAIIKPVRGVPDFLAGTRMMRK